MSDIGLLLLPKTVHKGPYFVAGKDVSSNTLLVTNDMEVCGYSPYGAILIDGPRCHVQVVERPRRSFTVQRLNWISGEPAISPSY